MFAVPRCTVPEALLDEHGSVLALAETLLLLVGAVAVLDERGGLATQLEALLCVVAAELRLNENRRLRHLLRVDILQPIDEPRCNDATLLSMETGEQES